MTTVTCIPKLNEKENDSGDIHDMGSPMPMLSTRHCDDTFSDEDIWTDESKCGQYYEWEHDLDKKNEDKMDETQHNNVESTVSASLIQFIQMLILAAHTGLLTCLTC
jgi:hypothetical protein